MYFPQGIVVFAIQKIPPLEFQTPPLSLRNGPIQSGPSFSITTGRVALLGEGSAGNSWSSARSSGVKMLRRLRSFGKFSKELTYPLNKWHFEDDFFPNVGYAIVP